MWEFLQKEIMICLLAHSAFFFGYLPQKSCRESCQQQRACVWHPQLVYKRNTCSVQHPQINKCINKASKKHASLANSVWTYIVLYIYVLCPHSEHQKNPL
jgi:hypothetical protein